MGRLEVKKVSLIMSLTALGVALAPFLWFPFFGTRAFPGQHLVNAVAGIVLGPWWAAVTALLIGVIRNMLGIGTIYAFPGGIPGAIMVGLVYLVTSKSRNPLLRYSAALSEPLGTVLIGGTLSIVVVAPAVGDLRVLGALEQYGMYNFLPIFWSGWAISSIPGSVAGYLILLALEKAGILRQITSSSLPGARRRHRL